RGAGAGRGRHQGSGGRLRARTRRAHSARARARHSRPRPHAGGGRQGVQGRGARFPAARLHRTGTMRRDLEPATVVFTGAAGNRLVGDVSGGTEGAAGAPVLLLHGGGQTRHSWRGTARRIVQSGSVAYAFDQRGHGDSEWVPDGHYAFQDFAADARALAEALTRHTGFAPVVIGASLGGIAALLAEGAAAEAGRPLFAALVLVDITPRVDADGVSKIQGFMSAHAEEGFASISEAADAVAAYLPHRPRPRSQEGL